MFGALTGGQVATLPESPSGLHIRGGASGQTGYELDGIPVLAPYHASGLFSAWNPDGLSDIRVSTASAGGLHGLSGVVAGTTKSPGPLLRGVGAASTTQARMTVDGPLGVGGAGYLLSVRSGFPGGVIPIGDPAQLRGETGDLIAKVELPLLEGRLRLLAYDSENELSAVATADPLSQDTPRLTRNGFAWRSGSVGVGWKGSVRGWTLGLRGWNAYGAADVRLLDVDDIANDMVSRRSDLGAIGELERRGAGTLTQVGVSGGRSATSYQYGPTVADPLLLESTVTSVSLQVDHARRLSGRVQSQLGMDLTRSPHGWHASPSARLEVDVTDGLTVTGAAARRHQLVQSLRNEESIVGNVFPADLYLASYAGGVPVARADEGILAMSYRPLPGLRVALQGYARQLKDIVLVATQSGAPFATSDFDVGSGTVKGVALDGALSGSRYGVLASYAWQRVGHRVADVSYAPAHATAHRAQAGVILHLSPTTSVRTGATGAWGRRTTGLDGAIEWEACNLLDGACEFGGTPTHVLDPGGIRLPGYVRLDLGVRKHWHVQLRARDATLAIHGTVTNIVGRKNVLNYSPDPMTGVLSAVEMLPLAPLVIGLELVF